MPLNEWTEKFLKDPLGVARTKSISPPHGYQSTMLEGRGLYYGVGRSQAIDIGGRNTNLFQEKYRDKVGLVNGEYRHAKVEVPIGMLKFEIATGLNSGGLTFNIEQRDASSVMAELARDTDRAMLRGHFTWAHKDKIPVYFLPWQSKHLLSLSIPEYNEQNTVRYDHGVEIDAVSPHIFFTAAINGCSVFVNGDPARPTVTHAGISEGSTPYGNDPASFWRDLLGAHQQQVGARGGSNYEVNNTNYVNATGRAKQTWTPLSAKFNSFLRRLPDDNPMKIEQVQPFGAVFGIRYGRLWSFYLQENVQVTLFKVVKKKVTKTEIRQVPRKFLGFKTSILRDQEVEFEVEEDQKITSAAAIPMRVSPFFPKGPGSVTYKTLFRQV